MRYLPAARYVAMPWRNGKGMTEEIARAPAAPADFDWRLSLAAITEDGPFSHYAGYERAVVLVSGDGFCLDVEGDGQRLLQAPGAVAVFDGATPVHCRLTGGPCRDLSLMVRRPGTVSAARALDIVRPVTLGAGSATHRALYVLQGGLQAVGAGEACPALVAGDSLLFDSDDTAVRLSPGAGAARVVLLEWLPAPGA